MNNYKKVMPRIISIATTLFKHVFVALAYFVIQFLFFFFTSNYAHTALEVQFWNSFILIVVYFSTSFAFSLYNKQQCFIFLSKNTNDIFPEFTSFDFIFDIVGTAVFLILFSVEIVSIPAIIAAFLSNIINFVLSRRMWLKDKENKVSTRFYNLRLIAHLLLSIIGILLFFFFAANLIPAIPALILIAKMFSFLLIIPVILAVFLYIKAINKMHKFLSEFKKFCNKNRMRYPEIKMPYLSIFKGMPDNTFILKANGKAYSCSIISFTNIFLPVVFKSDGYFFRISYRSLKQKIKPFLSFERRYTHESEHQKILIITSLPYVVKLQEGNKMVNFDTGDMTAGCKIFTPRGLFGAIERNTIERRTFE